MSEQHVSLDDVAGMVAEMGLTLRYQQNALDGILPVMRHQLDMQTNIDSRLVVIAAELSGIGATLQAMLRELQKLNAR